MKQIQDIKPFDREEAWKRLTRKQKAFVQHLIDHPKESATAAARAAYNTTTADRSIASENLTKPDIQAVLAGYDVMAQETLADGLTATKKIFKQNHESKMWEYVGEEKDHANRLKAADSILDRIHGKAAQKINMNSTTVSLNVSLSDITRGQNDAV